MKQIHLKKSTTVATQKKKNTGLVSVQFLKSGVAINYMHAAGEEVLVSADAAKELEKLGYVKILS